MRPLDPPLIWAFAFDICSINELTLILVIIDLCDIKPIVMLDYVDLDIYYH